MCLALGAILCVGIVSRCVVWPYKREVLVSGVGNRASFVRHVARAGGGMLLFRL